MSLHSPLHEELDRLADSQPPFRPDPALWDRGRRARRRSRVLAGAAALAVVTVVGGLGASGMRPDAVGPADGQVPEGAIPSRIVDPADVGIDLPQQSDLAVGPASVAFVSMDGDPTVVGATDGEYHALDLPDLPRNRGPLALSPDGRLLAWRSERQVFWADLTTGEVTRFSHQYGNGPEVRDLAWLPGSTQLAWRGRTDAGAIHGRIDITVPTEAVSDRPHWYAAGRPSPDGSVVALPTRATHPEAVPFRRLRDSHRLLRRLPRDLYPRKVFVTPVGWADDHLVVAQVSAAGASYADGPHLALFTSPDRPESEWTYRILVGEIPSGPPISVAVDLVPDLDGSSSQRLTHDFAVPQSRSPWRERAAYLLGGLLALLAGVAFIRVLRRQA